MLIDVTDRLIIREITMDDLEAYRSIVEACSGGISPELLHLSREEFASRHSSYIKYQYGFFGYGLWGVFLKKSDVTYELYTPQEEGVMIGLVGIINGSDSQIGELSYAILPEYRRKGYAFEACTAALEYGRECGFTSFEATIASNNPASSSLADKLGLRQISKTSES